MGRRSRKRASAGVRAGVTSRAGRDVVREEGSAERAAPPATRATRSRRGGERPEAPWGSFPLTELVVLLAIVLGVMGFVIGVETARGRVLLLAAIALGSLAGLEMAIRDHFAGYRSHTTLLSGAAAVVAVIAAHFLLGAIAPSLPPAVLFVIAAVVFAAVFPLLRRAFQRRSGGLSFR